MNHPATSAAQSVKELGDLLAELTDAVHFIVMHLSDDAHSPMPLIERGLLEAINRCEELRGYLHTPSPPVEAVQPGA